MWEMFWLWNLRSLCKLWEMCLAIGAFYRILFSSFSARWGHFHQLLVEALERVCVKQGRIYGVVLGVRPPPPRDNLRFSDTTGILPKKSRARDECTPLLKKSWIRPCKTRLQLSICAYSQKTPSCRFARDKCVGPQFEVQPLQVY